MKMKKLCLLKHIVINVFDQMLKLTLLFSKSLKLKLLLSQIIEIRLMI